MLQWIEARLWQILTVVFASGCMALAFTVWDLKAENGRLEDRNGYLAGELHTCTRLSEDRKVAIEKQNDEIQRLSDEGAEKMARAEESLAFARRENAEARRRVSAFLSQPIQGDTVCERALDIDRRFVEEILR